MRHAKKINHLSRKSAHRKAMLANMANSLIEHKRITTTVAKAKALRVYVEPIITKSKEDTTHSRRTVFSKLHNKEAVTELFREIAPKVANREGGYTRIIKLGFRPGDAAEMAMIELVDFNEVYETESKTKKKSTRRSRRGSSKKKASSSQSQAPKQAKEDSKADEPKAEKKEARAATEDKAEDTSKKEAKAEAPKKEEPKAEKKADASDEKKSEEKKGE